MVLQAGSKDTDFVLSHWSLVIGGLLVMMGCGLWNQIRSLMAEDE